MSLAINKTTYLCRTFLGALLAVPLAASSLRLYVSNEGGTTVQVIDPATNKVVQTIGNIDSPDSAVVSPDRSKVYITNTENNDFMVVDRKSGKLIQRVPISGHGNQMLVTPDGKRLLVCIRTQPGALDIFDIATLKKIKTIPMVGDELPHPGSKTKGGIHDIAMTLDGKYAVLGSQESRRLTVVDLDKMEIAWEWQLDHEIMPISIENNPDGSGHRIFFNLGQVHTFGVVDFKKGAEVTRVTLPDEPGGFGQGGPAPNHGIGVAPDGKTLWVSSMRSNAYFVYSLPDIKLLGHVPLPELKIPGLHPIGSTGHWIVFTPDSKTAYICNVSVKDVTAIDVKTMKEVARIPVGEMAARLNMEVFP